MPPVVRTTAPALSSATVTFTLTIPSAGSGAGARRRRNYVSPATNSVSFAQNGAAPVTMSLASTSSGCNTTAAGRVCAETFAAAAGANQSFTVKTFASLDGNGTPLSVQTIVVATILPGKSNALNLTLNGVLASLSVALTVQTLPAGQAGTSGVVINGLDASGNTIVGPGFFADANGNPIVVTLADNDTSGATRLGTTSVTQSATVPLTYTGAVGVTAVTITATAQNLVTQTIVLSLTQGPTPLTPVQVTAALNNVVATYQVMPHGNLSADLNTLATEMVQSGSFKYAVQTPGGISAILSDGRPAIIFADRPEEFGATGSSGFRRKVRTFGGIASPDGLVFSSPTPMPTPMPTATPVPTPLAPGPGPGTGHEVALLVNMLDTSGAFKPARQQAFGAAFRASGFTAEHGYNVDVLSITLANILALGQSHPLDLLDIATHGNVFSYVPTPGVTLPPNLTANNYALLTDDNYSAAEQAQYQSDFDAGNLVASVNLAFGGSALQNCELCRRVNSFSIRSILPARAYRRIRL